MEIEADEVGTKIQGKLVEGEGVRMFRTFVDKAERVFRERGYEVSRRRRGLKVVTNFGRFPRRRINELLEIADQCNVVVCFAGSALIFKKGKER